MREKTLSGLVLALLLMGMLSLAFNVRFTISGEGPGCSITSVTVSYCGFPVTGAYLTWTVNVDVTVRNNGTAPTNITVSAYYFNATFTQQIENSQNITDLPPDSNTTLTFNWDISTIPRGINYTVKANATGTGSVSHEFINGQMGRILWGDVNANGIFDLGDIGKVILIYSGIIKRPEWMILRADINGNGIIDLGDIGKFICVYACIDCCW